MDCGNILDYCSLDEDGKLKVMTLGEKEQQFLDACSVSLLGRRRRVVAFEAER